MVFLRSCAVHAALAVLVTASAIHVSKAQDLPFAFGTEVDDIFTGPNDDGFSSPVSLPLEMKFLGETVLQVFQNTNGDITFDSGYTTFTPELIPNTEVPPMVAIYWTDIDTRNGGAGQNELWIRAGTNITDLETANDIVAGTGASSFSAEAAIVATWNKVEAYSVRVGAQNTFQITMAYSDEGETWAIFAYVQLEFFSTDTAQRAVVGFNDESGLIGELINSIEDFDTMNLLLNETNCGIPGVFAYRVDEGIELSGCGILVEETDISPFQGREEGGTSIQVANLPTCLDDDSIDIYCRFEFSDRTVIEKGFRVSREAVECISPYVGFATTSAVSFATHVPGETAFDPTSADWVEVRQPFQFFGNLPGLVLDDPESFVLMADDDVELSWDKDAMLNEALESLNRILLEENAVDAGDIEIVMEVHAYDEQGQKFDLVQSTPVASGAGSTNVTVTDSALASYYLSSDIGNIKAVVHVRIAYMVGERYGSTRGLHVLMGVFAPGQTGDRRLGAWCDAQLALADLFCPDMTEIDIPKCPPTQPQAASNPEFATDEACTWPDNDGDCDYWHNGAHGCYRGPGPGRTGSQCCYDETDSALILDPDQGAGTVDCIAGSGGFLNIVDHFLVDVWPYLVCCKFTDSCDDYFDRRPPTDSDGYVDPPVPPRNFGDPHFRTFDGLEYTFNGAGEFVAFCSDSTDPQGACHPSQPRLIAGRTTLDLQLRFDPIEDGIGDGTFTVAAAIGDPLHRNGEFGIAVVPHPSRRLDVFDGLDLVVFPDVSIGAETTALFSSGLRITRSADLTQATIVVIIFTPSGLILRLTETNGVMLPSLYVTTGLEAAGSRGLYGVVDGDPTNDLMDSAGTVVDIDPNMTQAEQEELIFDLFGNTWMIESEASSLFQALQDSDQEWSRFYYPSYRPLFEAPALSPALQAEADAACGGIASDTIRAGCYFDIAVSGDVETYSIAAMGAAEQQEIIETLLNTPPSLNMSTGSAEVVVGEIGSFELTASDPDPDDTLSWELRHNDEALFTLEGSAQDSRNLSFDTADASEGTYRARVAVSDGTASAIFDATVTILPLQPSCGDGIIQDEEDCDGSNLGNNTCASIAGGFDGGILSCNATCQHDTSLCTTCGNGVIEGGEECDGVNLGLNTCTTVDGGFDGGTLSCDANCQFDTSLCTTCGNGVIEGGEDCDGANLDSNTCATVGGGFDGGTLSCDATCQFDTTECTTCGNGVIEGGEDCDGANLDSNNCATVGGGFDGGTLSCNANCQFDTSLCTTCGDAVIEGSEECDGSNLGSNTCATVGGGFDGGTLSCSANCQFDTSDCTTPPVPGCGDGIIQDGEDCDGSNLGGNTCASAGDGFDGGTLSCDATCQFDTTECTTCGNGVIEGGEDCDGANLDSNDCATVGGGFDGGTLSCNANCQFDTSLCTTCGDAMIEGSEECDGANLGSNTCATVGGGFDGGTLSCSANCQFDTSDCTTPPVPGCGNGIIQDGEDCDGSNLGGNTCASAGDGFDGGTLSCDATCQFDTTECTTCGNGVIEGGEECDGANLDSNNCATVGGGFDGGTLSCNANCQFDTSLCTTCGDAVIEGSEECDGANLGSNTCATVGGGFDGGTLSCSANCLFDTSDCTTPPVPGCGDGIIQDGEDCDGSNLGGNTCASAGDGFDGGTLSCDATCQFDTTECDIAPTETCGDWLSCLLQLPIQLLQWLFCVLSLTWLFGGSC